MDEDQDMADTEAWAMLDAFMQDGLCDARRTLWPDRT